MNKQNMKYSLAHKIIKNTISGSFTEQLEDLIKRICRDDIILRMVLFVGVEDNSDYNLKSKTFVDMIGKLFDDCVPAISVIAQKPLDADLVLELTCYSSNDYTSVVNYRKHNGFNYVILENNNVKCIFIGGVTSKSQYNFYSKSMNALTMLGAILDLEGFPVNSIVRQWNYIENITDTDIDGNQYYQLFNNARSDFYCKSLWPSGYPAATGIGTSAGGIIIDVDAVILKNNRYNVVSIDNKMQIAAHSYSENVLCSVGNVSSTPKFERAKAVYTDDGNYIYISGTAAIRGEKSFMINDVHEQFTITVENISNLIGCNNLNSARVYIKKIEDFCQIERMFKDTYSCPVLYVLADVCRNELLLEIEGTATVSDKV